MRGTTDRARVHDVGRQAKLTAVVVPSRSQRIGHGMLLFAAGSLVTEALKSLGDEEAIASRGTETLWFAPVLFALAVLAVTIALGSVVYARPPIGRSRRVAGQAMTFLGIVAAYAVLLANQLLGIDSWESPWQYAFFVGLALSFAGAILLSAGGRSAREELERRLGVKYLCRERWLDLHLRVISGLWLLVGAAYAIILATGDWELQFEGYAAAFFLGLGLIGAIMLVARPGEHRVLVDAEGRIFEPNQVQFLG
jgi:hypothetical protein